MCPPYPMMLENVWALLPDTKQVDPSGAQGSPQATTGMWAWLRGRGTGMAIPPNAHLGTVGRGLVATQVIPTCCPNGKARLQVGSNCFVLWARPAASLFC